MDSGGNASFVFVCPECDTHIFVDDEMRNQLLEAGNCLECKADVTADNFERRK